MWTKEFWSQATERAIKTFAQSAILALGASEGFNLFKLDWHNLVGFALGGMLLSFLTSLASGPIGPKGSPSLVSIKQPT
jgi:hypothetical protein